MPFAAFIPLIAAGLNVAGNLIGANRQAKKNMELARYQNAYNTPANQRQRYVDAGFNPNLTHSQGNPGNMSSTPQSANYQMALADIGTKLQQSRLMESQANLTDQKVVESGVKQDLMKAQKDLTKANPYMRQEYVNAMVTQLSSVARVKENEADILTMHYQRPGSDKYDPFTIGQNKILTELKVLEQRFSLNEADQAIKAKVLESKEFQNALQEIQVKWMKDKEITPQHIYQGIMLLLSKMM